MIDQEIHCGSCGHISKSTKEMLAHVNEVHGTLTKEDLDKIEKIRQRIEKGESVFDLLKPETREMIKKISTELKDGDLKL